MIYSEKLSKYLKYTIFLCLYLILITPILVSSRYLFPFITTKTIYFRVLVEIIAFLYLILALVDFRFRPRINKLSLTLIIFGGIIFLTSIFGVNFYRSFWGTIERGEGFLTVSHLIVLFCILTWVFKNKNEWYWYFTGSVFVSLAVSIYAMAQKLGASWVIHPGETRLSATIGNPAFLAAYLLPNIFFCTLLILERRKIWWRLCISLILILELYILFETETRGALLAFGGGILLLSLIYILGSKREKLKLFFGIILILFLGLIVLIWANKNAKWVRSNSTLNRLVTISYNDITTQSRFFAWDSSWKGWRDRFLFGYGWENYNVAFNKYFHPEIFRDSGSQLWFDRAHNTIFDVAVATGIFGLISYLALFFIAFWYLYYFIKNKKISFHVPAILAVALAVHFVQNIFVFDTLASYLMLFMIWAFISSLYQTQVLAKTQVEKDVLVTQRNSQGKAILSPFVIGIGFIVLLLALYNFNLKPLKANQTSIKALIAANVGKEREAIKEFKKALEIGTYQTPEIRQKLAENVLLYSKKEAGFSNQEIALNYDWAISEIEKNIVEAPLDVQNHLYLMTLYNASDQYDRSRLDKVIKWGEKALELSPTRPQIYYEMGQARMTGQRFEEGIAYFKKAVDLNPEPLESHWNLAAAYIIAGKDLEAEEEFKIMEGLGFKYYTVRNLIKLIQVYLNRQDYRKIASLYQEIIKLEPEKGEHWAKLAATYAKIGEKEKALEAAKKAIELDPSLKDEAERFLKGLGE